MKKILYSALALATAIGGVAASKANSHRLPTYFKLIVTPASVHDITTTANWTVTSNASCNGTYHPCQIVSSVAARSVTIGGVARQVPNLGVSTNKILASSGPASDFTLLSNSNANYTATNQLTEE